MNQFVAIVLSAVLLSLGANFYLGVHNASRVTRAFEQGCIARKVVATVGAEGLTEQHEASKQFITRSNFPGYTHEELVELTEKKEAKEKARIKRLEDVARESCEGL